MEESNNKKRVTSFFGANEEINRSGETGKKLNDILKRLYVEISNLNKSLKDKEEIIDRKEDIIRNLEKELVIAKRNVDSLQTENQRLKKSNQSKIHAIKRIKDSSNQKPKDDKIKVQEPEPVEVNLKEDKRPIGNDRKLAVITSFFNPANYVNIRHNYLQFSREIKKHADLFPIELSFNGEFFIEDENVIRINGNEENVLWQKERLLSIVLDNLPEEYTNVAWLDCDILFENKNWAEEINSKLEEYKVVQVYETAKRLDENGEIGLTSTGIIKKNEEDGKIHDDIRGTTGFGWAIRREVIDEIKFIDTQIIGGADAIMYFSFYGIQGTRIHEHMGKEWQLAIKEWCDRAFNVVNGSVGYISGSIIHLYHGKPTKRGYGDRHDVLREYKFDPNKHLELTPDGLWRFTSTELNDKLKKYFVSREEDDNILKVNEYFDKVYVLNLDRRPDRLEKITKELNSFGIEFDRFSAVDGNNISDEEYDFSKFVSGKGMIENKYALACLRSHIEIVKDAKKNNYERVLIFEDDIYLDPNFEVHLQNIKKIPNWGLIYFGATQYGWNVEFIEDFYFSRQSLGTFAYAIDSSVYDQILEADKESLAVDSVLSKVQSKNYGRCYTYYPNICIPDVTDSDIRGPRDQKTHSEIMRWSWAEKKQKGGPKISTIMVSRLSEYPGSCLNPIKKFHRAIESWEAQGWQEKELVIVSDGCEITNREWKKKWSYHKGIKLIKSSKSDWKWPGELRKIGIENATGDWINYLDSDDALATGYLSGLIGVIEENPEYEAFFNTSIAEAIEDLPRPGTGVYIVRTAAIVSKESMGTVNLKSGKLNWVARRSNSTRFATHTLLHKAKYSNWQGSNERGEDLIFSDQLIDVGKKFELHGYIICHHQFLDL